MAFPCIYTYNGKEYTAAELRALLAKGEFDDIISIGEPPKAEGIGEEPNLIAAKNAVIDAKRKELGLDPALKELAKTDEKLFGEVVDLLTKEGEVKKIVDKAIKKNRFTLSDAEQIAVAKERMDIDNKLSKLDKKVGDDVTPELLAERQDLLNELDNYDQVLKNAGTATGQALRARQFFIDSGVTKIKILDRMKADADGRELPKETVAQVDEAFKQLESNKIEMSELRDKIANLEERLNAADALADMRKINEKEVVDHKKAKKENFQNRTNNIKKHKDNLVELLRQKRKERGGMLSSGGDIKGLLEDSPILAQIALDHVKLGTVKLEELVDKVYDDVKDIYEGLTKSDLMKAISKYGEQIKQKDDKDLAKLRDLKRQMRLTLGMEDVVEKGELPKRSGRKHDVKSDEENILRAELQKAIKDAGLDTDQRTDSDKWKSAVKAAETSLINRIKLLDKSLAEERRIGSERTSLIPSDEMLKLRAERDLKQAALDRLLEEKGIITQERLNQNKKLIEKRIKEVSDDIKKLEEGTFNQKEKKSPVSDAKLAEQKAILEGLKDTFDRLYTEKNKDKVLQEGLQKQLDTVQKAIDKKKEKLESGNVETKKKEPATLSYGKAELDALNDKLYKKRIESQRINKKIQNLREENRLKNQNAYQRGLRYASKWERVGVLSSPLTVVKLIDTAIERMVESPVERVAGKVLSKIPIINKIAERSPRFNNLGLENVTLNGKKVSEDSVALAGFMKGFSYMLDTLKGKETPTELENTTGVNLNHPIVDLFQNIHGAIKGTAKEAEYYRSIARRAEWYKKEGYNLENPDIQAIIASETALAMKIKGEAFKDAKRAILMNDSWVVSQYQRVLNERDRDKKHPNLSATGQFILRALFPIVKIPVNYIGETAERIGGVPIGIFKTVQALRKGVENLSPEEADRIMRLYRRGSVGLAALAFGMANPQLFGGYYNRNDKREEGDVHFGNIKTPFGEMPHWLLHSTLFEAFQMGATLRRVFDKTKEEGYGTGKASTEAGKAVGSGLAEQIPFYEQAKQGFDKGPEDWLMGLGRTASEPVIMQQSARWLDTKDGEVRKTNPQDAGEFFKEGIPFMRNTVTGKSVEFKDEGVKKLLKDKGYKRLTFTQDRVFIDNKPKVLTTDEKKEIDSKINAIVEEKLKKGSVNKGTKKDSEGFDHPVTVYFSRLNNDDFKSEIGSLYSDAKKEVLQDMFDSKIIRDNKVSDKKLEEIKKSLIPKKESNY